MSSAIGTPARISACTSCALRFAMFPPGLCLYALLAWPYNAGLYSAPATDETANMRTSQYLLSTLKETPSDAVVISHQLLLRAG